MSIGKILPFRGSRLVAVVFLAFALFPATSNAQVSEAELRAHMEYSSSNYAPYRVPANVRYTKAPKGYKPFYISHYGRHGSRYHHSRDDYSYLHGVFSRADSAGALTELGKHVLNASAFLDEYAGPRTGDLTQQGVHELQGIAERMAKNFPEVFKARIVGGKQVPARVQAFSSTSGRCIVSMSAFLSSLTPNTPRLDLEIQSGKSLMGFINSFDFGAKNEYAHSAEFNAENERLWQGISPDRAMGSLFTDPAYVAKNVDAGNLYNKLFEIRSSLWNLDSDVVDSMNALDSLAFDSFAKVLTDEERIARWKAQNAWWYSILGSCPLTVNKGVEFGRATLRHILDEADWAVALDTNGGSGENLAATFRFGHDSAILPLAGLLRLPVASAQVRNLSKLHEFWNDFRIQPMAANLQIVFYKPAKVSAQKPVLVKVLYNEIEQVLPVECRENCPASPFYRWDDLRKYFDSLL